MEGLDALTFQWPRGLLYAFPLVELMQKVQDSEQDQDSVSRGDSSGTPVAMQALVSKTPRALKRKQLVTH